MVEAPHLASVPFGLVWRGLALLLAAADTLGRPTEVAETVVPATMVFSSLYLFMRYGPEVSREGTANEQTSEQPEGVPGNVEDGPDPQSPSQEQV